jgi:hypothetical protein
MLTVDDALRAHIRRKNVAGEIPTIDSVFIEDRLIPLVLQG